MYEETINVSGFGAQDEDQFEAFSGLFNKYLKFLLVKGRGIVNSIQSIHYLMDRKQDWFFKFSSIISLLELKNLNSNSKFSKEYIAPEYPYIFVNLNRSASFYKVSGPKTFTKLSGSIIGDSTVESLFQLIGLEGTLN